MWFHRALEKAHPLALARRLSTRPATRVRLQLDYFMSAQFAGVALALQEGLYAKHGLTVELLPDVEPGQEPHAVLKAHSEDPGALCVGTIEQNVLAPCATHEGLAVAAVAAMFGRSPLGIAALPPSGLTAGRLEETLGEGLVVGAHVDTVGLLQRLLPRAEVRAVPRGEKLALLLAGAVDAVQVYDVMEPLALEAAAKATPIVLPLHVCTAAPVDLGYAQVLFVPADVPHRAALRTFLEVTFQGWAAAIRDPGRAAGAVLALQPKDVDHWVNDMAFTTRTIQRCCAYVEMMQPLGAISPARWKAANEWLAGTGPAPGPSALGPALDSTVWPPA